MRTARLLTVSRSIRGGVVSAYGVCLPEGVSAVGRSAQGGVCLEVSAQGVSAQEVSALGVSA